MSTPSTERAALADELFALIAKSQTQMLNVTDRITIGSAAGELRRCDGPSGLEGFIAVPKDLLEAAICPECDGSGGIPYQVSETDWEQQQCQWCFERTMALASSPCATLERSTEGI